MSSSATASAIEFLKWGQKAFDNFRVVPPATGIVHQVNLEYLAKVVQCQRENGIFVAYPDTLVGTDSHTTMINGLGVLGWGVGGIEAEAVMLGPADLYGYAAGGWLQADRPAAGRRHRHRPGADRHPDAARQGRGQQFVEFYGPGLSKLSLADRATIGNMAPEYGATVGFFPVDQETLRYLAGTGRSEELVDLVERYTKEQGLFRTDDTPDPVFSATLELDMRTSCPAWPAPSGRRTACL